MALKAYVTTAGAAVLNYLLANQGTLTFVRADLGSGHEDDATACRALTAVKTKVTEAQFVAATLNNGNARVSVQYDNASLATGFNLNEIGLFVTDPQTSNPVLYCYITFEGDADVIAPGATASYIRVWDIVTPVSTLATVSATISSSAYATTGQLATQGLPTGGSQGQVLVKSSATDYASSWQTLPSATDSATGLMTSTDHAKLTGIEAGANNYTHPNAGAVSTSGYPTADKAPGYGGTFEVSQVGIDNKGHVKSLTKRTLTLPAAYTHPAPGTVSTSGYPTANQAPAHGGSFDVSQVGIDSTGHVKSLTRRTITLPAQYVHPSHTQRNTGLYKVHVDNQGHVDAVASVAKGDITGLGIPAQDTTYSPATTSANGLMSAADKTELNAFASSGLRTKVRDDGVTSLDNILAPGLYFISRSTASGGLADGWPHEDQTGTNSYSILEVIKAGAGTTVYLQRLTYGIYGDSPELWFRTKYGNNAWREWQPVQSGYTPA